MLKETYKLAITTDKNRTRYIVGIAGARGKKEILETTETIYWLLRSFQREDWRQEKQAKRHLEHLALSDEELYGRAYLYAPNPEDLMCQRILSEKLLQALRRISPLQAKRFLLHYYLELSIKQIADSEKCGPQRIRHSIELAKKNLRKFLRS
jgi:RNA polymerase sigma-70 factor (ECF subfamily)